MRGAAPAIAAAATAAAGDVGRGGSVRFERLSRLGNLTARLESGSKLVTIRNWIRRLFDFLVEIKLGFPPTSPRSYTFSRGVSNKG